METLLVIPARGGSTRVPLKNLQKVAGEPLIVRAIHTAKAAKNVQRIAVSTDHPQIADLAASEGAEVVLRPLELGGDRVPVEAVLLHALKFLGPRVRSFEVLVLFYCTAPFANADDIDGVLGDLVAKQADCAFAVVPIRQTLWAASGTRLGQCGNVEAESLYATRVSGFLKSKTLNFGRVAIHSIDPARGLVIETPADLYRARQLAGEAEISLKNQPVIYVDIDETICIDPPDRDYRRAVPIPENIAAINRLLDRGHTIVYWTARGGKSGKDCTELTSSQLTHWGAKHHRLVMGKPSYDLLICDKATSHVPCVP
jgi:CMP-N-acetylneuraminic acid synthetase